MQMLARILIAATALVGCMPASAGPLEGEMFGYRLGSIYKVGPQTQGSFMFLGQMVIVAERPESPQDLPRVEIIASPKTFTIANIYAKSEFSDEESAKELEARYADLLGTMYGPRCVSQKAYLEEALKLLCSRKYELTVHRFKPTKPDEKHVVHVGLTLSSDSLEGKQIRSLFKGEMANLERQASRQRLDRAHKDGALKGLQ